MTVNATVIEQYGYLKFEFTFAIEGANVRECYSGMYLPNKLSFRLTCGGYTLSPARKDLRTGEIMLSGGRIKKDGTPGRQVASEHFYSSSDVPSWVRSIIQEAYDKIQEN